MKLKRRVIYSGIVFFLISITGCVYLHLLEVRRQLSNFENNFEIRDQNELTLVFLKPVLLTEDIIWLTELGPTSEEETGQGKLWKYTFEKQYSGPKDEKGDFDIPIIMLFQKDNKLREIRFPERFLEFVSKPLLIRTFKSMGYSQISKLRRSATSKFQGSSMEIPRKQFILNVLGKPSDTENSDHTSKFVYKYNLRKGKPADKDFKILVNFTFQQGDDKLRKAEGSLGDMKLFMDFSVDGSDSGKNGNNR
ncbi:MAG: hypothetical protein ACM3SR_18370 [Ignavibacteriales bacterium]